MVIWIYGLYGVILLFCTSVMVFNFMFALLCEVNRCTIDIHFILQSLNAIKYYWNLERNNGLSDNICSRNWMWSYSQAFLWTTTKMYPAWLITYYQRIVQKISKRSKEVISGHRILIPCFFVGEQTKYLYNLRSSITMLNIEYCKCSFRIQLINLFLPVFLLRN